MKLEKAVYEQLIKALKYQLERGHFFELYEGFNNCTVNYERIFDLDSIERCCCGIKEAVEALRAAEVEVTSDLIGDWTSTVIESEKLGGIK